MKEENLIFIVSQPRAGSTYLQNLLSNNDEVNTCSEPWILLKHLNNIKPNLVRTKTDNYLTTTAFSNYLDTYSALNYNNTFKAFILELYAPLLQNYSLVIDKTPRYWEILDEIVKLFPKSKVIVLHRNPIDIVKSLIKTWDMSTFKELNLFRRDLLIAPKKIHEFCIEQSNNSNVYCLHYEKLILNTEVEIKKLYNWCGLKFSDSILDVSANKKYKGEFGDPLQNTEIGYLKAKGKLDRNKLKKEFSSFLKGYANFLGEDFLIEYGNYHLKTSDVRKSMAFNYFLHLGEDENRSFISQKSMTWLIKDFIYKLKFS